MIPLLEPLSGGGLEDACTTPEKRVHVLALDIGERLLLLRRSDERGRGVVRLAAQLLDVFTAQRCIDHAREMLDAFRHPTENGVVLVKSEEHRDGKIAGDDDGMCEQSELVPPVSSERDKNGVRPDLEMGPCIRPLEIVEAE